MEVDVPTNDATTAFHLAAWQGHLEITQLLVSAGAYMHSVNASRCNYEGTQLDLPVIGLVKR